ncbi:MAG TPA: choice-of-anchor D domain-containing protein [Candidatus Acidoferrum sp.]|nr:choice-of-anchor D domain-containing protein [Candidatus Acidoferrum sp.]
MFATLNAKPSSLSFSDEVVGHQSKSAKVTLTNTAVSATVILGPLTVSTGFVMTSSDCPATLAPRASCTIGVAFAPVAKGKVNGQLQLNSNAEFGLRTIELKGGKGLAAKMKARPKALSFEPVPVDAVSSAESIMLINDSPAPISFSTAPAATPPFNVTANTCDTIAANGGTCTISVEFAPHKRGKYHGILEIHDDAAGKPLRIKLFGSSK